MKFNVEKIIAHFGGRASLHQQLQRNGLKIALRSIDKWRERESIPQHWLAELVELGNETGNPLRLHTMTTESDNYTGNKPSASEPELDSILD
ncbi:hypothetical protein IB275_30430 [Pseudomonas sp. PDM21]|uniref:carph-isopro domain-containing protein n=1 Tax=Pseudomonas sp. PDM21 TaxID=2769257 RepID=UPI00177A9283|nr:hypothetical protein [Pseudomonas sp. PDM21]MBD9674933.1 hypothetical protein [Pseudomonas sp. PDM21]